VQDERGVGQAEQFGHDDAGLPQAQVFRLQAGEHQVGVLGLDGGGQQARHAERVATPRSSQMQCGWRGPRPWPAPRGWWADALRPGAEDDHFAAVLFLELQRLFERVGVGLVQRELKIGLFNPFAGASMRTCASRSGTCLMATMIFMMKWLRSS
jgi:hypothetical protein